MSNQSKQKIKIMIAKDLRNIYDRYCDMKKNLHESVHENLNCMHNLIEQIPQSTGGPLFCKTPKVSRKRGIQYIETIPEDDVISDQVTHVNGNNDNIVEEKEENTAMNRARRKASKKASDNITRQQSITLKTKLRKTSNDGEVHIVADRTITRISRSKRTKSSKSSSDDEDNGRPLKHSKLEENMVDDDIAKNIIAVNEYIEEPSMYEDAISKSIPVMNSTMKPNSTYLLDKIMNATVVLEPLPKVGKLNETVTIARKSKYSSNSNRTIHIEEVVPNGTEQKEVNVSPPISNLVSKKDLQDRMQQVKQAIANGEFDEVFTDDESSSEKGRQRNLRKQKRVSKTKKQEEELAYKRRSSQSILSSDEEIPNTCEKKVLRERNAVPPVHELKSTYKTNTLFSPYAKESVKKKIEAFEQAGIRTPTPTDVSTPPRLTRTKTRAMAAAETETIDDWKNKDKKIAQKLARKSLKKAKKISLAKDVKDPDEVKENKVQVQKVNKLVNEKINQRQQQLLAAKTTPLGKTKIQLPMSVNRIPHTPVNTQQLTSQTKALTASRIVMNVDSFLQPPKSLTKFNSTDHLEDKKKNEEDARRKKDEALRLQTEEKRRKRQEKELKNKLAREAKEKQEMEKRQRVEKEKQEKAKLAQQMQEKQREEMERKRLAQLQRALEKEEKRKLEEQQRLQRLREQEEAERLLAEQRRKEQEAEKRKEVEARAQQHAAAEALRLKNQMLAHTKQGPGHNKHPGTTNYILDSEPDEEESDDESRPKHAIPYWAEPHVRKAQLSMQRYVPEISIFKFFDTRKCTPDLTELFHGIDRNRLKRTSSAVWKTPPRYSMMEAD